MYLADRLASAGTEARCGLAVIDLRSSDAAHWLRIEGPVEELFDVVAILSARRPSAIGFRNDEIRRVLSLQPES